MSPATVIGSLLFLFLTLLVMAIAVSLYDAPRPARKQAARKATGRTPRQEIHPVVLNRTERMELIESTRNMVVTHPAGVARLVRNWIFDGS